ncbi:MAG: hypothetical protein KAQ68_09985 [Clostridiales bacterium]|nr:hypothetical protein [Clostridiales bacterium]
MKQKQAKSLLILAVIFIIIRTATTVLYVDFLHILQKYTLVSQLSDILATISHLIPLFAMILLMKIRATDKTKILYIIIIVFAIITQLLNFYAFTMRTLLRADLISLSQIPFGSVIYLKILKYHHYFIMMPLMLMYIWVFIKELKSINWMLLGFLFPMSVFYILELISLMVDMTAYSTFYRELSANPIFSIVRYLWAIGAIIIAIQAMNKPKIEE